MNSEQERTRKEYEIILEAFIKLLDAVDNNADPWELIEDIIFCRTSFLIERCLEGLQMDFEEALSFLRNHNNSLSDSDRRKRELVVAAVDNLVEFAVAEEYNMLMDVGALSQADREECEAICERYNYTYAVAENEAVVSSAETALWWLGVGDESIVTYMTQGDERVRAWHLSYEGVSYPKNIFPQELIPPIEWGCRCYLVADDTASLKASIYPQKVDAKSINPVFSESLAKGGRIFSLSHSYFKLYLPERGRRTIQKIKEKFLPSWT